MEKKVLIVLLLTVFFVCSTITLVVYSYFIVLDTREIYAEAEIGKSVGLNADNESLLFGRITKGGSSKKNMIITNNNKKAIDIIIQKKGTIAPLLNHESKITLEPDETREISFYAYARDNEQGNYSGSVLFIIKRHRII